MYTNSNGQLNRQTDRVEWGFRVLLAILIAISFFGQAQVVAAEGARQISGVGFIPAEGECTDPVTNDEGMPPDLALKMTGDLEGCLYTWVVTSVCHPSGTYNETGYELYVGSGGEGDNGTFETTYRFTAKVSYCATFADQDYGRCQHPIVSGSGTGDFAGVKGRFDIKDNIVDGVAINFPYTGHLKY